MLDQTRLPETVDYLLVKTASEMARAISDMIVRGAPAIGIAGAYGVVLSVRETLKTKPDLATLKQQVKADAEMLRGTRPTAVNLAWALDQLIALINQADSTEALLQEVTQKARQIHEEDLAACIRMGNYGAELVPKGAGIITHCNAGGLATAGYGTALGVIRSAFAKDGTIRVYADETRPRLQGARLTTWELLQDNIPVTLITDGMSGLKMKSGKVDLVVTGADRIAANGDSANKIGTYNLAIVARAHNIPFYIAAPLSSIDLSIKTGDDIPIEERDPDEIAKIGSEQICPKGTQFYNPAFDVTPAEYIAGIITEKGIARPPYNESLKKLFG